MILWLCQTNQIKEALLRGYYALLRSCHEFDKNASSFGMNAAMLCID